MDIEIIRKTVTDMVPFGLRELIPSTMGEPLLYEQFLEILEICRKNQVMLNLTTNGTWPKYGPEKWAELICPVARDIKISWNGASKKVQEGIMKGSDFERRLDDLQKFVSVRDQIAGSGENRCSLTLQVTFLESNIKELPDLIELASEFGIDRVKGHQLWVHFPGVESLNLRRSKESIRLWNETVDKCIHQVEIVRGRYNSDITLDNFNKLDVSEVDRMPEEWICPFLGYEAWVNHQGRFDPCCAPDAERKNLGYYGNVTSNGGLSEIWNGNGYAELRQNYKAKETCKKCTLRRPRSEVEACRNAL